MNTQGPDEHSPELLAAQERLLQLRAGLPARSVSQSLPSQLPRRAGPDLAKLGQALLEKRRRLEARAQGAQASDALKAVLNVGDQSLADSRPQPSQAVPTHPSNPGDRTVKVYPGLTIAMLKAELAAAGRVYWLLRFIDRQGRGWLWVDDVRQRLTKKGAELHICGWRRLRQLLAEGEDLFWQRDGAGRLWLAGAARIAARLSVERLAGKPVEMPVTQLLGGIKVVRAHLYASFHSGRRESNPISRSTLRELTDVPERTQLEYEQLAGVRAQRNIAVGEQYSQEEMHERAWRQGRAVFHFIDVQGKRGRKNAKYVAWHMPNSYEGPHSRCCKGRQKKINQELRTLVHTRDAGQFHLRIERLFWPHGAAAGKAYNRNQEADAYWPDETVRQPNMALWHVIAAAHEALF